MSIIREERQHAEAERAEGAGGGTLSRRGVLGGLAGGLAALPVLSSIGSAAPALAATATRPGSVCMAVHEADRVTWDAGKLPFLWLYGEFGGTNEVPYHHRFYTLALQPLSRNPYPRSTSIL